VVVVAVVAAAAVAAVAVVVEGSYTMSHPVHYRWRLWSNRMELTRRAFSHRRRHCYHFYLQCCC
jgi:hypothetical protein